MNDVAIIVGVIFALIMGICVSLHVIHTGQASLLDWSLLSIGGIYGVGWALVLAITAAGNNPEWESWILGNSDLFLVHTESAYILAVSVWLGWTVLSLLARRQSSYVVNFRPSSLMISRIGRCAWFSLLAAFFSQVIYSNAYGGLIESLKYSALIRSDLFEYVPNNPWSFLRPLTNLAQIASFIFFGLVLSSPTRWLLWLGLGLSISLSVYVLYASLGRIEFLVYLGSFIMGSMLYRNRSPVRLIAKGGLIMIAILVGAYYLSEALGLKFTEGIGKFLAKELSFPFASFFGHLSRGEYAYRWFIDFVVAPIYLLPSSIWTRWIGNVADINTALIMGAPKGEMGVTGEIPVDLLTLGVLQAFVLGIVVVGLLFGIFLRLLQHWIGRIPHSGVRATIEAYVTLKIAILGIFYAQPALVVSGNFHLLAGAVLLAIFILFPRSPRI